MDSVTCSAWSLDRQLLEISMKDLDQGGEMGTSEDHSLSPSDNTGQSPKPISQEKSALGCEC